MKQKKKLQKKKRAACKKCNRERKYASAKNYNTKTVDNEKKKKKNGA